MDKEVERILDGLPYSDGVSSEGWVEDVLDDIWIQAVVAAATPRPARVVESAGRPPGDRKADPAADPGTDRGPEAGVPTGSDPAPGAPAETYADIPPGDGGDRSQRKPDPGPSGGPGPGDVTPGCAHSGGTTASTAEARMFPVGLGTPPDQGMPPGNGADASVVRLPGELTLADSLGIARSLRPLMRRVPAIGRRSLDAPATATGSSEAGLLLPSWCAGTERWLSLDLVVDTGSSMAIWRSMAGALRTLLGHQGAFRDVRCWGLDSDAAIPGLVPFRRHGTAAPPPRSGSLKALGDPSGRRTVLLLTDGVGPLWSRKELADTLGDWSRTRAIAVLQVLPRSLWHRTRLNPEPVDARPSESRGPVPVYRSMRSYRPDHNGTTSGGWIPVLELDSDWIGPWAGVVAGSRPGWTPMFALPGTRMPDQPAEGPAWGVPAIRGIGAGSPAESVERFRREASPLAFELAGYFAAAPLCLPVMRLLQRVMLERSNARHLAEVFLSGLLVRADHRGSAPVDPEDQLYDFREGVREELLSTLTRSESLRVLEVVGRVSDRIVERLGGTLDFRALVAGDGEDGWTLAPEALPFARIALSVLAGVGVSHRRLKERIAAAVARAEAAESAEAAEGTQATRQGAEPTPTTEPEPEPESVPGPKQGARLNPPPHQGSRQQQFEVPAYSSAAEFRPLPQTAASRDLPAEPSVSPFRTLPAPVRLHYRSRPSIGQPMLFVGLGGTGARIGAELEQRLRADFAGADGTARSGRLDRRPHQLPGCLQFVYADMAEPDPCADADPHADPHWADSVVVPGRHTTSLHANLGATELIRSLRLGTPAETASWLPPTAGQPRLSSLRGGSGQLPTLARAGLFGRVQRGPEPLLEPLSAAIDAIARSDGELMELGGGPVRRCDVFVAFSAGGGTGAGIFLDYLHLISQAFVDRRFPGARLHPLVVLPSGLPGAPRKRRSLGQRQRVTALNSGRALIDLFRLVDEQNAPSAVVNLGDDVESPALRIRYPQHLPIRLTPGVLPTAFLFGGAAGIGPADLQSSVVSWVMSLIGPEVQDAPGSTAPGGGSTGRFLDDGASRKTPEESGIGRRGVSSALTATLTVPVDPLAELMACRTLVGVLDHAGGSSLSASDRTRLPGLVRRLLRECRVQDLVEGPAVAAPPELDPSVTGAQPIADELRQRRRQLESQLEQTRPFAESRVLRMAEGFEPRRAVGELLGRENPAIVEAVVNGVPGSDEPLVEAGLLGTLRSLSRVPSRPVVGDRPPAVPVLRGRLFWQTPMRVTDQDVVAALQAQDEWYHGSVRKLWNQAWQDRQALWFPKVTALRNALADFTESLRQHAESRLADQEQAFEALYRARPGVVLLPPPQQDLDRIQSGLELGLTRQPDSAPAARFLRAGAVPGLDLRDGVPGATRALDGVLGNLVSAYADHLCRRPAEAAAATQGPAAAAGSSAAGDGDGSSADEPLLPPMGRLLGAAAGSEEAAAGISAEARDGFTERLAELLPSGFAPEGSGPLKVLVIRPVTQWHPNVDRYLAGILRPRLERGATLEFRASETDSVTVVLLRTGMGLHELPETRSMLATLELARAQGRPQDLLAWRQRLGHLDDPSPAAPDRQRELLHRLLCCLWNGQVDVLDGSPDSPQRIRIRTGTHRDEDVPELELWLDRRLDGTSSWADLLTAYERWACAHPAPPGQAEIAHGLLTARPLLRGREVVPPDPLFLRVVGSLPPLQLARLDTLLTPGSPHLEPWACARWRFWAQLLPGALELHFDSERVGHDNLRSIMEVLGHALPFPAADGYDGHQRRPPWEEQRQGR